MKEGCKCFFKDFQKEEIAKALTVIEKEMN